mmetsp:Transcript_5142/g.9738  ORF Transcript_5142/g.9738 Transcript_5142/m.9738 type:complete len:206 (-) Transcript_5142:887-1504(-)
MAHVRVVFCSRQGLFASTRMGRRGAPDHALVVAVRLVRLQVVGTHGHIRERHGQKGHLACGLDGLRLWQPRRGRALGSSRLAWRGARGCIVRPPLPQRALTMPTKVPAQINVLAGHELRRSGCVASEVGQVCAPRGTRRRGRGRRRRRVRASQSRWRSTSRSPCISRIWKVVPRGPGLLVVPGAQIRGIRGGCHGRVHRFRRRRH